LTAAGIGATQLALNCRGVLYQGGIYICFCAFAWLLLVEKKTWRKRFASDAPRLPSHGSRFIVTWRRVTLLFSRCCMRARAAARGGNGPSLARNCWRLACAAPARRAWRRRRRSTLRLRSGDISRASAAIATPVSNWAVLLSGSFMGGTYLSRLQYFHDPSVRRADGYGAWRSAIPSMPRAARASVYAIRLCGSGMSASPSLKYVYINKYRCYSLSVHLLLLKGGVTAPTSRYRAAAGDAVEVRHLAAARHLSWR